jgi:hypothetical protein
MGNAAPNSKIKPFHGNSSYIAVLKDYFTDIPGDYDKKFEKLKDIMKSNYVLTEILEKTGISITTASM